jgi:hypothetical protein
MLVPVNFVSQILEAGLPPNDSMVFSVIYHVSPVSILRWDCSWLHAVSSQLVQAILEVADVLDWGFLA